MQSLNPDDFHGHGSSAITADTDSFTPTTVLAHKVEVLIIMDGGEVQDGLGWHGRQCICSVLSNSKLISFPCGGGGMIVSMAAGANGYSPYCILVPRMALMRRGGTPPEQVSAEPLFRGERSYLPLLPLPHRNRRTAHRALSPAYTTRGMLTLERS